MGLSLDVARNADDVYAFFSMLKKYYSARIYHYLPEIEFFLSLLQQETKRELGKIFLVRYKNRIIGGSVWLLFLAKMFICCFLAVCEKVIRCNIREFCCMECNELCS